jgi:hypothetical protein
VGGVESVLIRDNVVTLTRTRDGGFEIDAIRVVGQLEPRALLSGNAIAGLFTQGIYVQAPEGRYSAPMWKAEDNYSTASNSFPRGFIQVDNYLS